MKVLVGKCFGLGNAICSIAMLKALRSLPEVDQLDVLVGTLPDDGGTTNVFKYLGKSGIIDHMYINSVNNGNHDRYDIAIMSIPFDGRWKNGRDFNAIKVMDTRGRPNHSQVFGFSSWKKHEVEYQMENARELGYNGLIPDCSFGFECDSRSNKIYLGVGYKKDDAGYFKQKHWGNENYIELVKKLLDADKELEIISTGDILDWNMTLKPIVTSVDNPRFKADITNLDDAFKRVSECAIYFGNDTGMMHVAAAAGLDTVGMFFIENTWTKSSPWCLSGLVLTERPTVEHAFNTIMDLRDSDGL